MSYNTRLQHDKIVMDLYHHQRRLITPQPNESYLIAPFVRVVRDEQDLTEIDLLILKGLDGRIQEATLTECKTTRTRRTEQKSNLQLNTQEHLLRTLFGLDVEYQKIGVFKR